MKTNRRFFRYLNLLLFFTGLTFMTSWLPFLRGLLDGPSYEWGSSFLGKQFSGSGTGGDYYYVLINVVTGLFLLASFYWIRQRWVFYSLLIVWYGSMIANAFYEVFAGQGYMFHGDTLNIHLNLAYVILPVMVLAGVLAGYVILKDKGTTFRAIRTKKNSYWLAALLLPIPFQYFLLSGGEPHGLTDQIGVVLALLQVVFLYKPFKAYRLVGEG